MTLQMSDRIQVEMFMCVRCEMFPGREYGSMKISYIATQKAPPLSQTVYASRRVNIQQKRTAVLNERVQL